jgi:hypothetical protein
MAVKEKDGSTGPWLGGACQKAEQTSNDEVFEESAR